MREVNLSLATMPGMRTESAAAATLCPQTGQCVLMEAPFGPLTANHVQLVPQSFGHLTEDVCSNLMSAYPGTQFRLHANVRIQPRHIVADLSGFEIHRDWFAQAARISRFLQAPAYTAHSGLRSEASMSQMLDNARRAADLFGVRVGVEGHYPMDGDVMLITSWAEYQQVLESGVPFVVDLSHIHILACKTGVTNTSLVQDMLASENCLEVHLSSNDGAGDWHQVCDSHIWWMDLLDHVHPNAVIFSEGNHRRMRVKEH